MNIKTVKKLPPHNFTKAGIDILLTSEKNEEVIERLNSLKVILKDILTVEIDKRLKPLIESTDNTFFYRHLFIPIVYINEHFIFDDVCITGIVVGEFFNNELAFDAMVVDSSERAPSLISGRLCEPNIGIDMCTIDGEMANKKYREKVKNHIRNIICNINDFVTCNVDDVEIRTVHIKKEQNIKRQKQNKNPLSDRVIIKPKKHFIKYINEFNIDQSNRKFSHKFLVRGHWRHFRNKKYSEFKRQNPAWVKPYYKGEGILINKSYLIKDE